MKKIIAIALASGSTALLAGCGSSPEGKNTPTPQVSATSASPTATPSLRNSIPMPSKGSESTTPSPSLSSLTSAATSNSRSATPTSNGAQGGAASSSAPAPATSKVVAPTHASGARKQNGNGGASQSTGGSSGGARGNSSQGGSGSRQGSYSPSGGYTPPRSYVAPKAVNAPAPRNSGSISSGAVYPTRIAINKIGINQSINAMGLTARGLLDPMPGRISWYNRTPVPGKPGNSVLLGHVTYNFYPDAFYNLPKLNAGDKITITYSNGAKRTFTVYSKASVDKQALRTDKRVWGSTSTPTLVLATCDVNSRLEGRYHRSKNYVVWAK